MKPLARVGALAMKELLHVQRDPRTLYLALAMPVLLLLLFGFGVSFDADRVPIAVVDRDGTEASRALVEALFAPDDLVLAATPRDEAGAVASLRRGEVAGALVVPAGYGETRARTGTAPPLQLLVDGVEGTIAVQTLAKATALVRAHAARLSLFASRSGPAAGVYDVRLATYFNPAGESVYFIVPGITAYVVAIVAVMLTALTVAREWEQGSMEQLFATPVTRLEIVVGKLLPYLWLGLVGALLVLATGMWVFGMPFRGDPATLLLATLLFVAGMLGQGLLISTLARDQLVATQVATMSSLLPSLLLSGFIFPIANMPLAIQAITVVVPARYFVEVLRGVLLRANGLGELWPALAALAAFTLATLAVATARFKREIA